MNSYSVIIREEVFYGLDVDAETADEARKIARERHVYEFDKGTFIEVGDIDVVAVNPRSRAASCPALKPVNPESTGSTRGF
jgi:hypothetical protein